MDKIWEAVIAVVISAAGRLASLFNMKDPSKLTWSKILMALFVAGVAGILTLYLARIIGLSGDALGLVCGVAGWTSPMILHSITRVGARLLGFDEGELDKRKRNDKR